MNEKKPLKIIKYVIIAMIVVSVGAISIQEVLHPHENEKIQLGSQDSTNSQNRFNTNSVFDTTFSQNELTYVDEKLEFSIKKPNYNWSFNSDLEEITQMNAEKFQANGFLGGLYVEKNGDKSVLVTVFDIPDKTNFSLENYIDEQISLLEEENLDYEVLIKDIAPDKKTVTVGIETDFGNGPVYGEQTLKFYNDKLYMLQFTETNMDSIENTKLGEKRFVVDSFLILS